MVRSFFLVAAVAALAAAANAQVTVFSENNDGATNQFTATKNAGPGGWALQSNSAVAHSGSGYWMADDPAQLSDYYLTTPSLTYLASYTGPLHLSFWHEFNFESTFDGGVVEINVNNGGWNDIGSAAFTQNGYTGTISNSFGSPIGGRAAFTGASPGFTTTSNTGWINSIASVGGLAAGNTFQLRFRSASDTSVGSIGWLVDDVNLTATPVPEPASLALLGLGAAALIRRRRQR